MITSKQVILDIETAGINQFRCICKNADTTYSYAFYVYRDGQIVERFPYQNAPEINYWAIEPGVYAFKVFIKNADGEKVSSTSSPLPFSGSKTIYCNVESPKHKFDWLLNVFLALQEIWVNRKRMIRISRYDYRVLNKDAYLGNIWNILNPLIQIGTYWFVFGLGLRRGADVKGYPYIVWMLCGMIPWFFMSACIVSGAGAIRSRGMSALKMRYPIATMPVGTILVNFYSHIWMVALLLITILATGNAPSLMWLNLIYYFIYALVFFSALSMITSVFTMIAMDFQKLVAACIRLLFYMTPILWTIDNFPPAIQFILRLNPCLYYVDGFRDTLLFHTPFYIYGDKIFFFWTLNILLLIWGSNLQMKYKNQFMDLE